MWNFLLDLVSDNGGADFEVSVIPGYDDTSFMTGFIIGMVVTIIMVVIVYFANKYINDDDKNNNGK